MGRIVCDAIAIYWWILIASILASWLVLLSRRPPSGPMRSALGGLNAITEPVFRPVRSLLPPVRAGGMGFDLSPIIVFIVLGIIRQAACG